jgi:hypothetical protein
MTKSHSERRHSRWPSSAELILFEMANLYPGATGLPMTVWVSPRAHARHDARVKVNITHGKRMDLDQAAVVAIRPAPRLIEGSLSAADQAAVSEWIRCNEGSPDRFMERRDSTRPSSLAGW